MRKIWTQCETFLKQLKRDINVLALVMKDPRTPRMAKLVGFLTLLYALSPIDLIPDFIPVLGYLDDLLIVPFGVWLTYKLVPDVIVQDCRRVVAEQERKKLPRDWRGFILVLLIWIGFAIWMIHLFYGFNV